MEADASACCRVKTSPAATSLSPRQVYKNHGGSRFVGFYEMHKPMLMVGDPELVKAVLIKDFDHFVDRRTVTLTAERDEIFKDMLTQATGNHWKGIRSVLTPTFTSGRMKRMFPLVGVKANDLIDYIHREIKSKSAVPIKKCFGLYTLEVISSCAFGMETNSLTQGISVFFTMVQKLFSVNPSRMLKFVLFLIFPTIFKVLKIGFAQPELEYFKDIVAETMKQREKTEERRGDFLDIMMEARENQEKPATKTPKYRKVSIDIFSKFYCWSYFLSQ